ncbi:hypothetical protein [Halorussus ruber]|nr:hypothetical protein [Halorussus ruber]
MQLLPLRTPGTPPAAYLLVLLAIAGLWKIVRWFSNRLRMRSD